MKRCPECRRDYYDDTLLYCLDDGNVLLEGPATASGADEPATAILHSTDAPSEAETRPQIHTTDQTAVLPPGIQNATKRGFDKRFIAAAFLLVMIIVGGIFGYRYLKPSTGRQINSIAVLPFENKSGNEDSDYLSDGIAESLIYKLSQLPDLKVSTRSSVFRYKGREIDTEKIGSELGVDAVMSGRIIQRGDKLTISVDLVDVRNRKTLWGEQYQRNMSDLLATQRDIATTITEKLQLKLSGDGEQKLAKKYTEDNEAYQLYLQGLYLWNRRTEDSAAKAREFFQKAIDSDPKYALAYVGLANGYIVNNRPAEYNDRAKSAAAKALELDPSLGEAHAILANIAFWYEWDFKRSEVEFKKAIELNPNYPTAHHWYGETLGGLGRVDESGAEFARAVELDPVSMAILTDQGMSFTYARQYDRAIEHFKKLIEIDPNFVRTHFYLATAYEAKGMFPDAIEASRKGRLLDGANPIWVEARAKRSSDAYKASGATGYWQTRLDLRLTRSKQNGEPVDPIDMATDYAKLGNADKAFEWLETAFKSRRVGLIFLKVDSVWDNIRSDPRFADLIQRVGLP